MRTTARLLIAFVAFALAAGQASADDAPKLDVSISYTVLREPACCPFGHRYATGWAASAGWYPLPKNERGDVLAAVADPEMLFARLVRHSEWSNTVCLRFIDPYGDAVFNQLQIPTLVRELEARLSPVPSPQAGRWRSVQSISSRNRVRAAG
jgi:hypothetical protein